MAQQTVKSLTSDYETMVEGMRASFKTGKTKDLAWRREQLNNILDMFHENHEAITAAVRTDLGGSKLRGLSEVAAGTDAIHYLKNLSSYASEKWVSGILSREKIRPEPKGVVLVMAPWNFPFTLSFQPLVAAIAAGNCVVLKPSELNPTCAPLIASLAKKYLDSDCIKVVEGAIPESTALLNQHWDHIFYTGNGTVGRVVMQAAAKNLTPVTLELGGKSPVIVDETANMEAAVGRVAMAKFMNCGQFCVAPDYVLVHESREQEFVEKFKKQVAMSFGDDPKSSEDLGKMVNQRHAERVKQLIASSGGTIVCGGADLADVSARYVPPTVILNPKRGSPIMQEEIFGPVLPIVSYKNLDEAIDFVNSKETPLALYVYSQSSQNIEKVLSGASSGGACVNSSMEQLIGADMPFGGKGASGMGCYHGKFGFDEFSHNRGLLRKTTLPGMRGPAIPLPDAKNPAPDFVYDLAMKMQIGFFPRTVKDREGPAEAAALSDSESTSNSADSDSAAARRLTLRKKRGCC